MAQPDFGAGVDATAFTDDSHEPAQPFGVLAPSQTLPAGHPGAGGARYYTIQRVNGGAAGKENEAGGHKHKLEESDAIKKNSVKRKMLKEEKEKKRLDVSLLLLLLIKHPSSPIHTEATNSTTLPPILHTSHNHISSILHLLLHPHQSNTAN
jgi:hypothetical protein